MTTLGSKKKKEYFFHLTESEIIVPVCFGHLSSGTQSTYLTHCTHNRVLPSTDLELVNVHVL